MSWNLSLAGRTKQIIKDQLTANTRVPPFIQAALCAAVDHLPDGKAFILESAGHIDDNGGNVKFNIRTQQTFVEGQNDRPASAT